MILLKELLYDYINKRKTLFLKYIIFVFLTFPAESIGISRLYGELFATIRKSKNNVNSLKTFYLILAIIIGWCLIIYFGYLKQVTYSTIIPDYLSYIRSKIFSKTISFYKNNYKDIKIGKYITRLLNTARIIKNSMVDFLEQLFPLVFSIIIIIIYFAFLNPKIALITLVGNIVFFITLYFMSTRCIQLSSYKERRFIEMSEKLHDSFGNLMNIYLNNEDQSEIKKNKDIEKKQSNLLKREYLNTNNLVLYLSVISALTFAAVIWYSYKLLVRGEINYKFFITIIVILISYFSYLINLSKTLPRFLSSLGIIDNSKQFLYDILSKNDKKGKTSNFAHGNINFKHITFKYPNSNKKLFDRVNLEIKKNEKIAIMGSSGSGKTTIIKLLLRMYNLEGGQITIANQDIKKYDLNLLRSKLNYINQKTHLFNDTIINNIKYGNNTDNKKINQILEKYDLLKVYQGVENGLYENAGVHGCNLSLGMQKVTMILRGVLKECNILIIDEPLAGLDPKTRKKIIKLILDYGKNRTLIIITHNKEIIPHMDRVVNINNLKN